MKKFAIILLSLMLVFSLAACGDNGGNGGSDNGDIANVKGEVVDTTVFSVLVPDGWMSFNGFDLFDSYPELGYDPTILNVYKGATSDWDTLTCPGVSITYWEPSTTMLAPDKSWYDNTADIPAFTAGDYTWEGFTYSFDGSTQIGVVYTTSPAQFTVTIYLDAANGSISLDDAAVQAMLASLTPNAE